ncbi:MAG: alpha/beta hydrolase [Acidimicrobiia bacterium]|nr:alpha/beta hydrolase [Acidimicrobiia bacterium]MDH5292968.1 alpha/beta hydrolase [Acidimicrobiia bacterium]
MPTTTLIDTTHGPLNIRTWPGRSGPVFVLVHGLGGSSQNWDLTAPRLDGRCVALDLPGFGLSHPRSGDQLDRHCEAVVELIQWTGAGQVNLVGNSMGGLVTELVAASRPDLVANLALISPATPLAPGALPADKGVAARLVVQSLPGLGPALARRLQHAASPEALVRTTFEVIAADPARIPAETVTASVELARLRRRLPWAARTYAASAASIRRRLLQRAAFAETIARISCPTTLIWGAEDRVVSPSSLRWLAGLRPDWTSLEIDGVGHVPMLEAPDVVMAALADWLSDPVICQKVD